MKAEIKTERVEFLVSGDSPDIGAYVVNEVRELSGQVLKDFVKRGIVRPFNESKPTKKTGGK